MKYTHVYTLFLVFVFHTACGQNQTNPPQDNIKSSRAPYSESQLTENSAGNLAVSLAATSKVPVSMVRNIKQARNGDILIASYLGVFRYDGTSFTNLTSTISSPRFSSFWDVLEDRKGNLWFGTRDSGVYHYDGKSLPTGQAGFQHFTAKDGLGINSALHIYEDRAGNIWVGSSRYDGKSFRNFTTKDGFPSNSIRLLLEDKTGKLWFGAQGENMFVYDGKTFTVLKNKDGKAFKNVWSIIEDKKGNIWTTGDVNPSVGSVWALSRYDQKSLYDEKPTVTEIMSGQPGLLGLLEANDGSIWFGGLGSMSGVHRYDGKTITDFKGKEGQK